MAESAVIVERERGASWRSIGQAADSTKQSAHERWADAGHLWTLHGRRRRRMLGPLADAHARDEWYADLTTANERYATADYVITAGLAATDPRNVVERRAADKSRSTAQSLYRRLDELRQKSTTAYSASFEAIGTDGHTGHPAAVGRRPRHDGRGIRRTRRGRAHHRKGGDHSLAALESIRAARPDMGSSNHPNHTVLARRLQDYLRWRNANARHPGVLAAQRRERGKVRSERDLIRVDCRVGAQHGVEVALRGFFEVVQHSRSHSST